MARNKHTFFIIHCGFGRGAKRDGDMCIRVRSAPPLPIEMNLLMQTIVRGCSLGARRRDAKMPASLSRRQHRVTSIHFSRSKRIAHESHKYETSRASAGRKAKTASQQICFAGNYDNSSGRGSARNVRRERALQHGFRRSLHVHSASDCNEMKTSHLCSDGRCRGNDDDDGE